MTNRIKSYLDTEDVPRFFSEAPSILTKDLESLVEGPKSLEVLIKEETEKARKAGFQDAIDKIQEEVKKHLEKYVKQIVKNSHIIGKACEALLPDLKMLQCRTNFSFTSPSVKLFFLVEAIFEDEVSFSNLLNRIEKIVFERDNFIIETFFVNKSDKDIDINAIRGEYPFVVFPDKG